MDEGAPRDSSRRIGLLVAGTYRVLERIGAGSMGEVFEVEHVRLGKRAAIKFLRCDEIEDENSLRRKRREAQVIAALDNEYVVSVLDCGELKDGTPYLVMERLVGEDLRTRLVREERLSIASSVQIALDICRGLIAVHGAGYVHRDLKPANVFLLLASAGRTRCKILDFGVVKAESSDATLRGALVGTLRYMAPEQIVDASRVGASSDIYSVGAILYHCLAGRPAHDGSAKEELMFSVLNRSPPNLRSLRPEVSPQLAATVVNAMARDPNDRIRSAAELAAALDKCLPHGVSPDEATIRDVSVRLPAPARVRWRPVLFLALAAGSGVGWLVGNSRRSNLAHHVDPSALCAEVRPNRGVAPPNIEPAPVLPASGALASGTPTFSPPAPREAPSRAGRDGSARLTPPEKDQLGGLFDTANPYSE